MLAFITFIIFVPIAFLSLATQTLFTSDELIEMGVCLENQEISVEDHQSPQPETIAVPINVACCRA